MRRFLLRLTTALAAVSLLVPATAGAAGAGDWASSLFSEGGVEVRADERVFTLFALFNAMGMNDAPILRKDPILKREYDPVRQRVRDLLRIDPKLRPEIEAFFDAHPHAIRTYIAFVLAVGNAPNFEVKGELPKEAAGLKGFEKLLARFYASSKIGVLFERETAAQRETLKQFAALVDAPILKARELLRNPETDDSPRLVLVVNLLDGRGSGYGVGFPNETYLVVGPLGAEADIAPAVKAFARVSTQQAAEKGYKSLKGGKDLFEEVLDSGFAVGAENIADYIAESVARAVAIKATYADEQVMAKAFDREHKNGFVMVKDMNRGLVLFAIQKAKPFDVFLADYLRELDAGKAVAALKGN
jgi:hypothetical protein